MRQFTIFQTKQAIIKGKKVLVEGLHDLRLGRQSIFYRINENRVLRSNDFWELNPKFLG
jgi:hypothetical protein